MSIRAGDSLVNEIGASPEQIEVYLDLLSRAHAAKENAYSCYSGFKVGAALLTKEGMIFTGCNVENSVYGLTMCAERTAIFKSVSEGYGHGQFDAIAVAASAPDFSPCGACRQVINEFGDDLTIIFEFGGKIILTSLKRLLPFNFQLSK